MKQTNFIGYENVVNIASPGKIVIFGEQTCGKNGVEMLTATDKRNRFNSKINKVVNHSSFLSKNLMLCQENFKKNQ